MEENQLVRMSLPGSDPYWIGIEDRVEEGRYTCGTCYYYSLNLIFFFVYRFQYTTMTNNPTYSNWKEGYPLSVEGKENLEDCVTIENDPLSNLKSWKDNNCGSQYKQVYKLGLKTQRL